MKLSLSWSLLFLLASVVSAQTPPDPPDPPPVVPSIIIHQDKVTIHDRQFFDTIVYDARIDTTWTGMHMYIVYCKPWNGPTWHQMQYGFFDGPVSDYRIYALIDAGPNPPGYDMPHSGLGYRVWVTVWSFSDDMSGVERVYNAMK